MSEENTMHSGAEGAFENVGIQEALQDEKSGLAGWAARLRAVPVTEGAGNLASDDEALSDGELPDVPDDVREAARLVPEHWLGVVDPFWRGEDDPPVWAILGQWRTNSDGDIVEWADNPEYRPSPAVMDWEEPLDEIDAAIQLAATGYGPHEEVERLLAVAELAVLVDYMDAPVAAAASDGTPVVPAFSSPPHLEKVGVLRHKIMTLKKLAGEIPLTHKICVNPTGPVAYIVDSLERFEIHERDGD
jgi:hypothetical protein